MSERRPANAASPPPPGLVVVTGASKGIGRATASAFADEGHPLLLLSRSIEPLAELEGRPVLYERVDVTDAAALAAAVERAEARFGPAACMVANAGILRMATFTELSPEDYGYEIDVLFKGVLNAARAVLPGMRARGAGTIVVVGSIGERRPGPGGSVYDAAKSATNAIVRSLQMSEAATGVRVVNIAPGFVRTDIHAHSGLALDDYKRLLGAVTFLEPEEIAALILYCFKAPAHVCIRDLVVMPTNAAYG